MPHFHISKHYYGKRHKSDPAFPREIAPEAKHALSQFRTRFLKEIASAKTVIRKHLKVGGSYFKKRAVLPLPFKGGEK